MAVQLAGLILISVICPVISVMAESLETLLLVHAASLLSTARLLSETRPAPASNLDTVRRSWHRRLAEHFQSQRTVGMMSLFCVATGFALLGSLAGSSTLETIQTTLRESYRPERADLLVGSGSILGSATCVLLFAGTAASFGMFPLHGVLMNGFESAPAGITGPTVLLQRLQASVVLWKTAIVAMPGFESTVLLLCVVFGAASCIGGSLLACRTESLRGFTGNCWITWGGVVLIAAAAGLTAQTPQHHEAVWQFPSGLEIAAFSLLISAIAVVMLLTCDCWLTLENRGVDFAEDVTGLGKRHSAMAAAIGCALLTMCAIPPLPGFWCAVFITGNAFLPGVESTQGPSLVPDASILAAVVLLLLSLLVLSARAVHFLSLLFLHEPIRRFEIAGRSIPALLSLTAVGLLLWAGLNVGTLFAWLHQLPL